MIPSSASGQRVGKGWRAAPGSPWNSGQELAAGIEGYERIAVAADPADRLAPVVNYEVATPGLPVR